MSNIFVNNIRALRWLPAICFAWVSSGCANTGVPCPQIDASAGVFSSAVFEDGVVAFEQSSSKRCLSMLCCIEVRNHAGDWL